MAAGLGFADVAGNIRWAKLVDLYEAVEAHARQIPASDLPAVEQRKAAAERVRAVNPHLADEIRARINHLIEPFIHVVPHAAIAPVEDVFPIVVPKTAECLDGTVKLEQMANFLESTDEVLLDQEIWEKLNHTQQAAFYVHEALYSILRDYNHDKDSRNARYMVGQIFSSLNPSQYQGYFALEVPAQRPNVSLEANIPDLAWNSNTGHFSGHLVSWYIVNHESQPVNCKIEMPVTQVYEGTTRDYSVAFPEIVGLQPGQRIDFEAIAWLRKLSKESALKISSFINPYAPKELDQLVKTATPNQTGNGVWTIDCALTSEAQIP